MRGALDEHAAMLGDPALGLFSVGMIGANIGPLPDEPKQAALWLLLAGCGAAISFTLLRDVVTIDITRGDGELFSGQAGRVDVFDRPPTDELPARVFAVEMLADDYRLYEFSVTNDVVTPAAGRIAGGEVDTERVSPAVAARLIDCGFEIADGVPVSPTQTPGETGENTVTCPRCGRDAVFVDVVGPTDARVSPCGCHVAPEAVNE